MTQQPTPDGRRASIDGADSVVFTRTFAAPIDDVWAALTVSERLERWIGTWRGDPAVGSVQFQMNAEGDGVPEETFQIVACEPPHRLAIDSWSEREQSTWHFVLGLAEDAGTTTLTFSQSVPTAELAAGVGPGWAYYLDRLVAAETGGDVAALDWEDYAQQSEHYLALFTRKC